MTPPKKQSFTALLEPDRTRLRWVIARVPFDPAQVWPQRVRQRVRGAVNGFAFRTSLFSWPDGRGCYLLVNRQMQEGAQARVGDKVRITLEPDLDEREVLVPPELARELKAARGLRQWFDALSESARRDIGKWVSQPRSAESRQDRAARTAERLLSAMEGESDPPPVLRALLDRQPQARAGWQAMTPTQRRGHLLGIFYYESPEARQRRATKAVDEALRVAKKLQKG